MGIPTTSAQSFDLLREKSVIDAESAKKLKKITGFRNTIIHQYQHMNLEIVEAVVVSGLQDLVVFGDRVLAHLDTPDWREF